ncbi:conjugal transfer protein [Listeria innocua]|nr:conjugal transfer protein [Listeria innocua]
MKKLKSYTNIWSVEKVIYAINDFKLPFPITFSQMAWFVCSLFTIILLADLPPLSFIEGALLKYLGIPVGLTWFMSQKTFDGKKPYRFIQTVITYFFRPKMTYAGKAVQFKKEKMNQKTTIVRSELIEVSDQVH